MINITYYSYHQHCNYKFNKTHFNFLSLLTIFKNKIRNKSILLNLVILNYKTLVFLN